MWDELDFVFLDEVFDFRVEPVLDAVRVEGLAAIGHGDLCAGAEESDACFDGGVFAADDQDALVGVLVNIAEVVGDMGEGFAGDVEHAWRVHIADGEDDAFGFDGLCV